MTIGSKPRVRIIGYGGTWCMPSSHRAQDRGRDFFLKSFPEAARYCDAEFLPLRWPDSSNLRPRDWTRIAARVAREYGEFDGFVVIQGTDTLTYTAAALSFALRNLAKPVVITGSQIESDSPTSDATLNVLNACRVAALRDERDVDAPALHEVAVVFGTRIIRATRCRKYSANAIQAFDTVNAPLLGEIGTRVQLNGKALRKRPGGPFRAAPRFNHDVALLPVYPGLKPDVLVRFGKEHSGIVLAAYGTGTIPSDTKTIPNPYSLERAIGTLVAEGIPVLITTQCSAGHVEPSSVKSRNPLAYAAGEAATDANAITVNDMTTEAAFAKLSWLLANSGQWRHKPRGRATFRETLRDNVLDPVAGEITPNSCLQSIKRR